MKTSGLSIVNNNKNYTRNTLWLIGGHAIRMGIGMVAAALVARYLGPEEYGTYNYVLSVVFILQIFGNLGLTGVLRKRFIEQPETVLELMGTAFFLNVLSGSILYGGLVGLVSLSSSSLTEQNLFAVFGTILIVDSFRCVDIWFNAQTRARLSVLATTLPVVLSAAAKGIAVFLGADLYVFAVIFVLETALIGVLMAVMYSKTYHPLRQWSVSASMCKALLCQSWPLILNGFAINLYLRMDQVMLRSMHDSAAVGQYAAASRLSTLWYMLPMLLASSLTPAILKARNVNLNEYKKRLRLFMDLNTGLAYLIAVPISLLSPWIILIVFGENYSASAAILSIHVWSCVFVFQGIARNVHIVGEGIFRFSLVSSLVGVIVNLSLNAWLIPIYSGTGAALATLLSQCCSAFLVTAAFPLTRSVFRMQCTALVLPFRIPSVIRQWKQLLSNG